MPKKPESFVPARVFSAYPAGEHKRRKDATRVDFTIRKCPQTKTVLNPESVCRTNQAPAKDLDANVIIDRYLKTGVLPFDPMNPRPQGQYGDFTQVPADYKAALDLTIKMRNEFERLKPEIRLRFQNDPGKLLEFLDDPKNQDEALALGLLMKPRFSTEKVETPEGFFWVTRNLVNGIEVKREPVKPAA